VLPWCVWGPGFSVRRKAESRGCRRSGGTPDFSASAGGVCGTPARGGQAARRTAGSLVVLDLGELGIDHVGIGRLGRFARGTAGLGLLIGVRSEEHTSELQSRENLV